MIDSQLEHVALVSCVLGCEDQLKKKELLLQMQNFKNLNQKPLNVVLGSQKWWKSP